MTLSWAFSDPSPGNTIYTINVYQSTDDKGTEFILTKFLKTLGFDSKSVSVTGLEEYWPYRFKVIAATGKGNSTSDFSSTFRTKSGRPGKVLDLHVTTNDYERAYVTWRLPDLKDHNGILQNYRYLTNKTGLLDFEYIPVNMILQTVQRNFSVVPSNFYFIQVCDCQSIYRVSITQWLKRWHGGPGFESRLRVAYSPPVTFGANVQI
eukprot:XP_019930623.1 PREDICTED: uncharacterized protein LOC109621119 [Crassostrea gigas]